MNTKASFIIPIRVVLALFVTLTVTGCTTGLHHAAEVGDSKTVAALLDKGENINESDFGGMTPLLYAVEHGQVDTVRLLLDRGADIESQATWMGASLGGPLDHALQLGHANVAKLLIERGADVDNAIASLSRADTSQSKAGLVLLERLTRERKLTAQQSDTRLHPVASTPTPAIKSDIDEPPLANPKQQKDSYAIVIGIEKYRQKLPNADYAANDARVVTEYLTKVMGYPREHIVVLINEQAAKSDFEKYFEKWLLNNVGKDSSVFIYYSGHGAPDVKNGEAYLVPYDGDPSFIEQTGYPLKRLYESLNKLGAKEIVVALDSCFSGAGGKSVIAQGARPLVMNLEQGYQIAKNVTVMSASSGSQISSTYEEKGHGLFTYFMLKGIKDGMIEVGELFNYLKPNVGNVARTMYNNEQSPQLIGSDKQVFLRN